MTYQQATFYFFTGTGNSYRVASWMADGARQLGADTVLRSLGSARPSEDIGNGARALLGLVMPTHGFTAPWAMLSFALKLPRANGTHAIVAATRAGMKIGRFFTPGIEGTATYLICLILAIKGYSIRGAMGVDMPSSWLAVHPGLSPDSVAAIVARAQRRVTRFVETILSGERHFTGWIPLLVGLLFLHISFAYLLIGRFFLAKLLFASDACTGCALCADHCPNQAIEMKGTGRYCRPYWTFRCESCMRCMAYCPTRAIEANYLLGIGAYLLATAMPSTAILATLAAKIPALAFLSQTPDWLVDSIYAIAALAAAYPVFHLLLTTPPINRFFSVTTPTHYYRRYHAPDTNLQDLL